MELVRGFIGRLSDTIESIQCLIPLRESSEHYNSDEVSFTHALTMGVSVLLLSFLLILEIVFFFYVKYLAFPLIAIYSSL
jgi:hypothetical protein